MRTIHLLAALPLTGLFASPAFAQACNKQLTLTNEIQMESTAGGPSSIPVKINGVDQKLTLATAGTTTQLSEDAAKALNLEIERGDMVLTDALGNPNRVDEVTIADFSMGRLHGTNVKWPVTPEGGRGGRGGRGGGGSSGSAGLFSLNYMRLYDVDADFGSDKLRLFSQDHCPGAVLYWKAPGAVGTVPITISNGRVTVPVMVDGKAITGVIDTASANSSVYAAIAEKVLGVEDSSTGSLTAKTVAIGQLTLNDVDFTVRPDINSQGSGDRARDLRVKKTGIDFELAHPEVRLGMDVLRKLHLYMAFGENKLYVTGTTSTLPVSAAKTP
jgi:predicted aspartyl protease